jgi:predicted nucleic acid-binding protein
LIIYLDTSAVVPLLIREPSSVSCHQVWNASDDATTSRLTYVETAAALAQALRSERMTAAQHRTSLTQLDAFWAQCEVVDLDQSLAVMAASMAHDYGLRGYDAVHCASAVHLRDADLVAVSGDRRLLEAWATLGLDTFDVNAT